MKGKKCKEQERQQSLNVFFETLNLPFSFCDEWAKQFFFHFANCVGKVFLWHFLAFLVESLKKAFSRENLVNVVML